MDKELNLILKLAEHPNNSSEASRLQRDLEKQLSTIRDIGQLQEVNSRNREEALRKEAALTAELAKVEEEARRNRKASETLRDPAFRGSFIGKQTDKAAMQHDERAAELEKKATDLKARLAGVREEVSSLSDEYTNLDDKQQKSLENGVRAYETLQKKIDETTREVERHTLTKSRAYQKLFQHISGGFQATINLAKSAALAYASAMDTDDETVKKWLQWFAAIESVSQGISGVYGTYRALRGIMEALNALRVKDIALAQAQARAEALVCAARQCGTGGPASSVAGGAGKAAGGMFSGGMMATAARWGSRAIQAGRAAGRFAVGAGGQLLGAVGWGVALGEAYNYATTGETLTGAIGEAWEARNSEQASRRRAEEMERRRPLANQVRQQLFNQQYNSREAYAGRVIREGEGVTGTANAIAGMDWQSTEARQRAVNLQFNASGNAAAFYRSRAESMETMEGGAEQAADLRRRAIEEEIQNLNRMVELKRLAQQLDMEAAQRDVNSAKVRQQMAEAESEFYKAIVDDVKREREQVAGAMAGSKGGDIRRGLAAREKAEGGGDLSYREAMAMRRMGLDNTEGLRKSVTDAMEREAIRKGGPAAASYYEKLNEDQKAAQFGADLYGAEAAGAKADVKVAQSIVIKLEQEQGKEIDALLKALEPRLVELMQKRNEEIEKAVTAAFQNSAMEQVNNMTTEELQTKLTGGGSR